MSDQSDTGDAKQSRRSEAFFGRRKGSQLTGRKSRLMANLLPSLDIDLDQPCGSALSPLFHHSPHRVHLEIGFGGGEHLAAQAEQHQAIGYIGVEPFINGMAKMLGEIDDRGLKNVRLYGDDAVFLLDWLPDKSLDQIDLLYPDPWPKKRHWKRRFVSEPNLQRFARVLKPSGIFRFASDIDTYINWTLAHVDQVPQFSWEAQKAEDWRQPWPEWKRTRYESKAVREGRPPCYLTFRRK